MGFLTSAIMGAMMSGQPKAIGMSMEFAKVKQRERYLKAESAIAELLLHANHAPGGEADQLRTALATLESCRRGH
jgi:hypothetical protein